MKPHPEDPRMMIMENIHEGRHLWPHDVSDLLTEKPAYQGAIFHSKEFTALAESFNPAVHGYEALKKFQANGWQIIYRDVQKDDVDQTRYASHWLRNQHTEQWQHYLISYADLVRPFFKNGFNVELRPVSYSKAIFHKDLNEINVVLPLGADQLSTIWKNVHGKILRPLPSSVFVATEDIEHSPPPVTVDNRAVLIAYAPYPEMVAA